MRYEPSEAAGELLKRRQGVAERLLDLAAHLAPSDRALVRAVYERGMSASEFARAARRHPRSVRLRLQRLVERVTSPTFQRVLAEHCRWPEERRRIARAIFLQGRSQRESAAALGLSIHRVRRESDRIRAIIENQPHVSGTADERRYASRLLTQDFSCD